MWPVDSPVPKTMHVDQPEDRGIQCNGSRVESRHGVVNLFAQPIENLGNGSNVGFDTGIVRLGYPLITITHSLNDHPFKRQISC